MNAAVEIPNPLTQLELHCAPDARGLSLALATLPLVDELALECDADGALVIALGNLLGLERPLAVTELQLCTAPDGSSFSVLALDSGNWLIITSSDAIVPMQQLLERHFHTVTPGAKPGSAKVQHSSGSQGTAFWLQPGERCQLLLRQASARRLMEQLGQ
uniref:hypothetical protein n=1 Tax=Marinobacterium profundum TaxID=1714300 RepID=UPI000836ACCA|nr:hypothetical protein [Marinobacterium profundum]